MVLFGFDFGQNYVHRVSVLVHRHGGIFSQINHSARSSISYYIDCIIVIKYLTYLRIEFNRSKPTDKIDDFFEIFSFVYLVSVKN